MTRAFVRRAMLPVAAVGGTLTWCVALVDHLVTEATKDAVGAPDLVSLLVTAGSVPLAVTGSVVQ